MELRHLRLFLDVHRRESFAAVARDHAVDPSSISRTIASLEAELGFNLFDRTTRKLAPTEAGAVYYQHVAPLVDDLERATELAGTSAKRPQGTLRILAPVSFSLLNVVPVLPRFLGEFPGLRVDLQLTDALLDLVENRIDVAIRLGPLRDSSYISQELAPMRARVCASRAFIERHGHPKTPDDLTALPCLLLDMPGFGGRWLFRDDRGQESHVDVDGPLKTSNAVALKQLALSGIGAILQAEWIVGRELADGALIDLFPEHEVTASHFDNAIWTLRPARSYEPAKVRAFLDFLRTALVGRDLPMGMTPGSEA
ncbi:MAG: LysR family transcriptional regulator [Planctomycetota bacterium]